MTVEKIDHVGIAVKSIEEALPYYRDVLGLEFDGVEVVSEQKVRVAFLRVGESRIELLEPMSPDSPISAFLDKRGPGIHHISVRVDDICKTLLSHQNAGRQLIDSSPRTGAHNTKIAFVHPKATSGVLLELSEKS
ncbi:MAG: methylmalonyl-CoA epimerase [Candidatus Thorarchaeota archaeon]|nr:methylmalonyl-CoA epimerase [Candidatus Thorarchaeota archaeon]